MSAIGNLLYRGAVALGYDAGSYDRHRRPLQAGRRNAMDEDRMVGPHDRLRMRQECLNLRRNNSIVAGIAERFCDNVVGSGITPNAKTTDPAWNREAEQWWAEWSKICDVRQRVGMREIQELTVQSRLWSGDLGFVLLRNGQIQPVEGERLVTPKKLEADKTIVEGVKVDPKTGIRTGYYVFSRNDRGRIEATSSDWRLVRREDFVYVGKPFRFDQVRAVPELAPAINSLRDIEELSKAQLERARMDAMRAWFIPTNGQGPGRLGARGTNNDVDTVEFEKFEAGQTYYGRPGDGTPESLASNTPNPQYIGFLTLNLRIVGSALGLPYEFLLMDFSEGSFSASRAALLQTYRTFTGWQDWLTRGLMQRLWNWRIAKAIKAGELPPAPLSDANVSEWYKVEWSYPEFGWVDPNAEALSETREVLLGKKSWSAISRKAGRDLEDVMAEKAQDISNAMARAAELRAQNPGEAISWRDLIDAAPSGQKQIQGSTASVGGGQKGGDDDAEE